MKSTQSIPSPHFNVAMPLPLRNMRLGAKVALMGITGVIVTAIALVILAVWQSGQYNTLARNEVDALLGADLDHITQGAYTLVRTENEAAQSHVDYTLNVARYLLVNAGDITLSKDTVHWTATNQFTNESEKLVLPKFFVGTQWLGKNAAPDIETPIVDEVAKMLGETATIFQRMNKRGDMLRVATTVKNATNDRAIGTYIPAIHPDGTTDPVVASALKGETYHGRAYVVNAWYLTAYEPIYAGTSELAGMLYVGIKQEVVASRVREAILNTKVGKTGYVYVLGGTGKDRGRYIISDKGERDGEDIWSSRDSDGRYLIQEIIGKAKTLTPGEMATVRYRWRNPGESEPRWKIARLAYFAPWDWVIGTSVYEDELRTYQTLLEEGRGRMIRGMGMAGILTTVLFGMIGVFIAWTITRPVRQITGVAEKIIGGDLDQVVEVATHDEIGILARTFNLMTAKLKQSMENLRESEEKYRSIFKNAPEGLFQTTMDGRFINVNPTMARILGHDSPEELMTRVTDIGHQVYVNPKDRDVFIAGLLKHGAFGCEVQFHRRGQEKIWGFLSARLVKDDAGEPAFIEGFFTDINDRKHAEEALAESRNYLNEIINAVADPMFVKDRKHRWVLLNDAMCSFMGHPREELLGKSDYDYFPKSEADVFWLKDELVFTSETENINEEAITDAHGIVHTIVTKKTLYTDKTGDKFIVGIIRDVTDQKKAEQEKKRLETRLTQAQKMEAVGTLAGGIAHDFNNILSAIIGYTELARENILEPEKAREELTEVLKASNRAKDLVMQILAFSRMRKTEYAPIVLQMVVKESLKMLRPMIPSTIDIRQNLVAPGMVLSDPTQIHQIVMNLCTNAVHAMDETGGLLEVLLTDVIIDSASTSPDPALSPGPYLKLSIRDTGKGIPPEIMDRIFDPYFTTKDMGRGTGLGLSVIHGIIENHKGAITCKSTMEIGTTFEVFLPRVEPKQAMQASEMEPPMQEGCERILLVDDDPVLANLSAKMLNSKGYAVVMKTSSIDALNLFRQDPQGFDLVITDMTMPGITGDRLALELISIRHDIPVILCTGYNEHISEHQAKALGIREFLLKPLDIKTITQAVRKVLDSKNSPRPH